MRYLNLIFFMFLSAQLCAQPKFSLFVKGDDGASCIIYGVQNIQKKEIHLPPKADHALQCPMIADILGALLVYNDTASVNIYNLANGKDRVLFDVPPHFEGVSGPCWSPSFNKAMFVIVDQKRDPGYDSLCRIMVISFDKKGDIINTVHFDRPVNFECGSICFSVPNDDYAFVTEDVIKYKRHELIEARHGAWEQIHLTK